MQDVLSTPLRGLAGNYSRTITSKRMDLVRDNYIE